MLALSFLAAALVIAAWLAGLVWSSGPAPWTTAAAIAVCLAAMIASKRSAVRALWFNAAFIVLALALATAYLASTDVRERRRQEFGAEEGLFVDDEVLGVRPRPGLETTAALYYDDELVYDVVYTIGDDGLRVSPDADHDGDSPCVLFFGGSFTFGEGVNDDETTAWRVGTGSGGRYAVRNFGFCGYGPHQMLAAIESGLVERTVHCRPTHAVYQAVYHHVLRSAGKWSWDHRGPRYRLAPNGSVERAGSFDAPAQTWRPDLVAGLPEHSFLARQLEHRPEDVGVDQASEADVALFHAIVARSARLLVRRYPSLEFHVIYWDKGDSLGPHPLFEDGALPDDVHVHVHRITSILPDVEDWQQAYKLPHDVHPTARTHALIADYLGKHVLED